MPIMYIISSNIPLSRLTPLQRKLLGVINVHSDATGQLLVIYSALVKYLRKSGNTMKQYISSL